MSFAAACLAQAEACAALGSPFMARLLRLLAEALPEGSAVLAKADSWPEADITATGAALPLRVAGALHALVLERRDAALCAAYPPAEVETAALRAAVLGALQRHEGFVLAFMESAPQTNEVRRSAALIPVLHGLARRFDLPLVLSELGASAGLNLMCDRFGLDLGALSLGPEAAPVRLAPDWTGPLPKPGDVRVAARRGVDLRPVDRSDSAARLRLFAYLWPDQPERAARTRAALDLCDATVDRADAVDWLETRLDAIPKGHTHLIYSTVAWQYLPEAARARGAALIAEAGARTEAPLAWLRVEADGQSPGAGMLLRLWPGDKTIALGRCDFHGRWVDWRGDWP